MLDGAKDNRLTALGSDHDEHALMADVLVDDQVFKHLLPVLLAITQMEVLQDEVIALLRAHAQRLLAAVSGVHVAHAQLAQHGTGRRTKVGKVVDDQKALLPVLQHQHDLPWND